ncbi:MAG TPA: amidohydrolase family protein [Candidatus Limnocylindria bacterium]|nr:amidohydrolase family protein [Candidatus Limnocylindria bacterium]
MEVDLVIRGGTIVDGSGGPPVEGDVAIRGERIVAVGRTGARGREEIDARGLVVTPGFVDVHTHLDAQLTWDPSGAPSSWHGVTSVVVGNCGVGFAPCRAADRDYLMFLMEGVEDIPRASLAAGMDWRWETFPQYLDTLGRLPLGVNVGAHLTHAPLRVFAMGERGATDAPPSDDELAVMRRVVSEAIAAGALGVSTGRTTMHRTPAGEPVPGTFADARELAALAAPLAEQGAGILQVIPFGAAGEAAEGFGRDLRLVSELLRGSGRPVSLGLTQARHYPDEWRRSLAAVDAARGDGLEVVLQVAPRAIGLILGGQGLLSPLILFPGAGDLAGKADDEVRARLADPALRSRIAESLDPAGDILVGLASMERVFLLDRDGVGAYDTSPERSVARLAAARGVHPGRLLLDTYVESDLRCLFLVAIYNWDLDAALAMLQHPAALPSLGDSGAHTSQTCDMGVPTFVLAYWVRERRALPLEAAVRALSAVPAAHWGIPDRGRLAPGCFADINILDLDRLDLCLPEVRHDLPGGATNLAQRAVGYRATIVNGQVALRDGQPTGRAAGRVLRNALATP